MAIRRLPFVVRLYFYAGGEAIRVMHTITYDGDEAKDFILGRDFDPRMGARPLERAVDQLVVQPLVDAVFSKQVGRGGIRITAKGGKLTFVS